MKNVLTVEIKDNKTIVTVAKVGNDDYSIVMHKSYSSKALSGVNYDTDIPKFVNRDLKSLNIINNIDEKILTINTSKNSISTYQFESKFNADIEEDKKTFLRMKQYEHPKLDFMTKEFYSGLDMNLTSQKVYATLEAVHDDYKKDIVDSFKQNGIKFNSVMSTIDSIKNSLKAYEAKDESIVSILVEEKFIQLTWIRNGNVSSAIKWNKGLSDIYEYIAKRMGVSKKSAKDFFKSFGSIPPEDVVDDKVIHNYEEDNEIFTKKDLSGYITEKVQDLFSSVKHHIETFKLNDESIKFIFSGEIKSLTGFTKFAKKSFNVPDIKKYKSTIIGLEEETEFITMGMLLSVPSIHQVRKKEITQIQSKSLLWKLTRMYNYI